MSVGKSKAKIYVEKDTQLALMMWPALTKPRRNSKRWSPCAKEVDPEQIAALTAGFSGADLANLVNEAAILATRRGAHAVTMEDFTNAFERIIAGLEKKNRLLNPEERKRVAYHEMGHALVALSLPGMEPVHKISIIPRGIGALGYTLQRPTEDRYLMTPQELENKMAVLIGGRAAEILILRIFPRELPMTWIRNRYYPQHGHSLRHVRKVRECGL